MLHGFVLILALVLATIQDLILLVKLEQWQISETPLYTILFTVFWSLRSRTLAFSLEVHYSLCLFWSPPHPKEIICFFSS